MASIVLPSLKRSITDIMDEELYQLPNSPIQVNGFLPSHSHTQFQVPNQASQPQNQSQNQAPVFGQTGYGAQPMRSDSPKLAYRAGSGHASPSFAHTSLYSHPNASNSSNLSGYLNIPDSFQEVAKQPVSAAAACAAVAAAPLYDTSAMDLDMQFAQTRVNPFSDYGNPDSLNTTPPQDYSQVNYPPLPQFPQKPTRRRRITTLDDESSYTNKKDEDYLLYNPDIQPSQLINNIGWSDDLSTLFVRSGQIVNQEATVQDDLAQEFLNSNNNIIPGYENDYLMVDGFDEEVEEELSDDDDEDEDNYFHVDDEFDELVMSSNNDNYNEAELNINFMELDDYLKPTSHNNEVINMHNLEHQFPEIKKDNNENNNQVQQFEQLPSPVSQGEERLKIDEDLANMNMDDEHFVSEEEEEEEEEDEEHNKNSSKNARTSYYMSAAEISANNPTHSCELINPSTGVPCSKQFSRPYDLIRHQETIHATKKKIFRCVICEGRINGGSGNGKQKTFSRGDALSRHIKVKHGLVGKEALDLINEAKDNVEYISV